MIKEDSSTSHNPTQRDHHGHVIAMPLDNSDTQIESGGKRRTHPGLGYSGESTEACCNDWFEVHLLWNYKRTWL
jgi:hypothetical protein